METIEINGVDLNPVDGYYVYFMYGFRRKRSLSSGPVW